MFTPFTLPVVAHLLKSFCYACGCCLARGDTAKSAIAAAAAAGGVADAITALWRVASKAPRVCAVDDGDGNGCGRLQPIYTLQPTTRRAAASVSIGDWFPLQATFPASLDAVPARLLALTTAVHVQHCTPFGRTFPVTASRAAVVLRLPAVADFLVTRIRLFGRSLERAQTYLRALTPTTVLVPPNQVRPTTMPRGPTRKRRQRRSSADVDTDELVDWTVDVNVLTVRLREILLATKTLRSAMASVNLNTLATSLIEDEPANADGIAALAATALLQYHIEALFVGASATPEPRAFAIDGSVRKRDEKPLSRTVRALAAGLDRSYAMDLKGTMSALPPTTTSPTTMTSMT
jgi:hypothetical protein